MQKNSTTGQTSKNFLERLNRGHMIFALLLMAQFQLWDAIITQVFVRSGFAREGNPFMAPLVDMGSFALSKAAIVAALVMVLWLVYKRYPRAAIGSASCVAMFYLAVITWNFLVLFSNTI